MKQFNVSLKELDMVAEYLDKTLPSDTILFLTGNLASGKTTLVKHILKAKGINQSVTSPTFSLQHKYTNNLYHYDLYRKEIDDILSLGIIDEFEQKGWHMIEWGSDALKATLVGYGYNCADVSITHNGDSNRLYKIGTLNA